MKVPRRSLAFLLMMPLTGCVFAVGSDDEGNEKLRDRVRDLEKRVDRIERPAMVLESGHGTGSFRVIEGSAITVVPAEPEPVKDPK